MNVGACMSASASSPYPQNVDPYTPAEGGIDIKALLGILKRRRRVIIATIVLLTTLAVLALGLVFILGGPTLVMAVLLALIHPLLGNLASIIGATLILWALIFGAFALPGIVLQRRGLLGALWDSVRLVHRGPAR